MQIVFIALRASTLLLALLSLPRLALAAESDTVPLGSPMSIAQAATNTALAAACKNVKVYNDSLTTYTNEFASANQLGAVGNPTVGQMASATVHLSKASAAYRDLGGKNVSDDELKKLGADLDAARGIQAADAQRKALLSVQKRIVAALDRIKTVPVVSLSAESQQALEDAGEEQVVHTCTAGGPSCNAELTRICRTLGQESAVATAVSPSLGGLAWQTAVVQGLADFLHKRAKDEAVQWLRDEILERFCKATFTFDRAGARPIVINAVQLFSESCGISEAEDADLSGVFASAIRADLERLPVFLAGKFLDIDDRIAKAIIDRLHMLRDGKPPLEVLAGLSADVQLNAACSAKSSFACELVGAGTLISWAGDAQNDGRVFADALKDVTMKVNVTSAFIGQVNASCKKLANCSLKELTIANDRRAVATFLLRVQTVYGLLEGWRAAPAATNADLRSRGLQMVTTAVTLLDSVAPLLRDESAEDFRATWEPVSKAVVISTKFLQGDNANAARESLKLVASFLKDGKAPPPLISTVTLSADLANAEDSKDVQAALDVAAAPIGSWKDKHRRTTISLTGFVGGSFAYESVVATKSPAIKDGFGAGAFAAVGADFATNYLTNWSWGLFLSAFDVGQLLTTPVAPGKGEDTPNAPAREAKPNGEIRLAQVLSPGAYLHTSLGDSPFTLGAGVALAPQLRTYGTDAGDKALFSVLRANLFLAIDLNLIPIYSAHSN